MNTPSTVPHTQAVARHIDDVAGRYACYPGIAQFRSDFGDAGFIEALRISNGDPIPARLSLHIGAPERFGMYPVGPAHGESARAPLRTPAYFNRLVRQIAAIGALCDRDRDVVQLALSPGAIDLFDTDSIAEIVDSLSRNFHFSAKPDRDFSVTLSANALPRTDLRTLVDAGCNRAGFAVGHIDAQAAADQPTTDHNDQQHGTQRKQYPPQRLHTHHPASALICGSKTFQYRMCSAYHNPMFP